MRGGGSETEPGICTKQSQRIHWAVQVIGWILVLYLCVGRGLSLFSYRTASAWAFVESNKDITTAGVAMNKGGAIADVLLYIPMIIVGLIGHRLKARWSNIFILGAASITVSSSLAWLFTIARARELTPAWKIACTGSHFLAPILLISPGVAYIVYMMVASWNARIALERSFFWAYARTGYYKSANKDVGRVLDTCSSDTLRLRLTNLDNADTWFISCAWLLLIIATAFFAPIYFENSLDKERERVGVLPNSSEHNTLTNICFAYIYGQVAVGVTYMIPLLFVGLCGRSMGASWWRIVLSATASVAAYLPIQPVVGMQYARSMIPRLETDRVGEAIWWIIFALLGLWGLGWILIELVRIVVSPCGTEKEQFPLLKRCIIREGEGEEAKFDQETDDALLHL